MWTKAEKLRELLLFHRLIPLIDAARFAHAFAQFASLAETWIDTDWKK
jgi:hypothetical protein